MNRLLSARLSSFKISAGNLITQIFHSLTLLASFAMGVSTGHFSVSRTPVGLKSVQNHVKAAASFAINASRKDPRYRYNQFGNKIGNTYFPALNLFYNSMTKWKKKSSQALPLTPQIITHLFSVTARSFPFSEACCIRDAVILGCFTGSRCGEYCSGKRHPGDEFGKVPITTQTSDFAGWPIAFCSTDIYFLSSSLHTVSHLMAPSKATMVRIRFRYDKGGGCNFSERTFHRVPSSDPLLFFLCPVATCIRTLFHWSAISNDPLVPVFCFCPVFKSHRRFLADAKVTAALRAAVTILYPDPSHFYRLNLQDVRTHSIQVYACLALVAAKFDDHIIEYKLRWASKAWKVYMRENWSQISDQTVAVFQAAFVTEQFPSADTTQTPPLMDEDIDDGN